MKREGDIVFINRRMSRGGDMGSVPQLWLKMHRYQGGGRRGKRAGYFLLSSSGSGRREERGEARGRTGEEEPLPGSLSLSPPTHLEGRTSRPPYSPVSPDPTPPNHCAPAAESAAPASATQRSAAQQTVVPRGQGSGPPPAWKRGCGSGSSGSRWSCERK